MTQPAPHERRPAWRRHLPLAVIVVVAIVGAFTLSDWLSFETLRENRQALLDFRDAHYLWMAVIFIAIYIAIVAFSLPGASVTSVTGGFLFGLVTGSVLNVASATVGATAIFLAARAGLGETLAARIDASEGRMRQIKQRLNENEVSVLFLIRLVPVVPFFVANLLPALVGVKFRNFVLTTALGIVPGTVVYTWIGVGVGEVFDRGGTPDLSLLWEPQVIGPVLGLAALAALPILVRAVRGRKEI
ncbi:TVP38/TMEM64 family protein [Citreimonas sp.]|uniref:TVP38/TMEM64 family protein n=1 Tax=Citreimonas sp. TaxID=3036715 RepID=UPI0040580741